MQKRVRNNEEKFLKYANEVIDINAPMDFFVIMDQMKQKIISKLTFCKTDHDKTVVDVFTMRNQKMSNSLMK